MKQALVFTALVLLAVPAEAQFRVRPAKTTCSQIRKGDAKACGNAVLARCSTLSAYNIERCERKLTQRYDACTNGQYLRACRKQFQAYGQVCMRADKLDLAVPKSIATWKANVRLYTKVVGGQRTFYREWYPCHGTPNQCAFSPKWIKDCRAAAMIYKKTYRAALDGYLAGPLSEETKTVRNYIKVRDYQGAFDAWEPLNAKVSLFSDINGELGLLKHKPDEVTKAAKTVAALRATIDKGLARKIARARCPRARYRNKQLVADATALTLAYYKGTKDGAVTIKRTSVLKRPKRTTAPVDEKAAGPADLPLQKEETVVANCLELAKPPADPVCRIDRHTLVRTRPFSKKQKKKDRAAFTRWRITTSSAQVMQCKHLK